MITGYASIDSPVRAVRDGAYDSLAKPFALGQLEVVLNARRAGQLPTPNASPGQLPTHNSQLDLRANTDTRLERDLGTRVVARLEPVIGAERVRVNVALKLNPQTTEETEERFDGSGSSRPSETTDFEVSKTTEHIVRPPGEIVRVARNREPRRRCCSREDRAAGCRRSAPVARRDRYRHIFQRRSAHSCRIC